MKSYFGVQVLLLIGFLICPYTTAAKTLGEPDDFEGSNDAEDTDEIENTDDDEKENDEDDDNDDEEISASPELNRNHGNKINAANYFAYKIN